MSRTLDQTTRGEGRVSATGRSSLLAVCLASRGLVQSRLMEGAIREVGKRRAIWCFSHDKGIPEAQNEITRKAMSNPKVTHLWYVEEDMLLPEGVLDALLSACTPQNPVVFVDYRSRADRPIALRRGDGEVEVAGMGCLLVRREVMEEVGDPYFHPRRFTAVINGKQVETGQEAYGGQDRQFCAKVQSLGFPIVDIPGIECGHLEVERMGRPGTNIGWHEIRCWGGEGVALRPVRRNMQEQVRVYIKSPTGTVIDMIRDSEEYLSFVDKHGWVEISAEEAQPYLDALAKRNTKVIDRVHSEDADF